MKRTAGALVLLTALGGCVTMDGPGSGGMGGNGGSGFGSMGQAPNIPGVQGPWGAPVAMAAPYNLAPTGADAARAMMSQSVPMDIAQAGGIGMPGGSAGLMQAGGPIPSGGGLMQAGMPFQPMSPGCGPMGCGQMGGMPMGAVAAAGASTGPSASRFPTRRTEVRFVGPAGMKISWFAPSADGKAGFSANHLTAPGRYNFVQAAVYRIKLSDIPLRPGLELYPTLEVVPSNPKTDPFLAHSAVPVSITDEDLEQVASGNYVVKVVYLPDPQFQDLATTGPDEVVSSRLEAGVDPVAEAHRRGNILLIVRMGNIDLEAPNSPAMDAPPTFSQRPAMPPGMRLPAGPMVPGGVQPYGANPLMRPNGAPVILPGQPMPSDGSVPPQVPGVTPPVSALPGASAIQQAEYKAWLARSGNAAAADKQSGSQW